MKFGDRALMRQMNSRMNVVRKDEKETKLTDFMQRFLTARRAESALDPSSGFDSATCFIVARSADSPVAKVLQSLLPEFSAQDIAVKALYALPGDGAFLTETPSPWAPPRIECRRAGDMRLLEAHEILILGPRTAWVGDCMRREPEKGDAYEFYADDCLEMAAAALRSFHRLWAIAKPLRPRVVSVNANPMPLSQLAATKSPVFDIVMPVSFSRH
jgi:hypothetical protein